MGEQPRCQREDGEREERDGDPPIRASFDVRLGRRH
jgi:hypothetical protein